MLQYATSIIIDNGSNFTKAGLSSQKYPTINFPSIIGRPNLPGLIFGFDQYDTFVGKEAMKKRGILSLYYPIQNGLVQSWEDIQLIWQFIFYNELKLLPEDYPCLLVETIQNSKINREKTAQVMFNLFNIPYLYIANQSVLSLYGYGLISGLVIDCGASNTNIVPVFQGYAIKNCIQNLNFGGNHLTQYFDQILGQISTSQNLEIYLLNQMKEQLCYVSQDYQNELKDEKFKSFSLPDGNEIQIGKQAFQCPETLFTPSLILGFVIEILGTKEDGIHQLAINSVNEFDIDKEIIENVLLSGGSTLFPGLKERLSKEFIQSQSKFKNSEIAEPNDRILQPWIGAQILSELSTFKTMCISKAEYDESGENILHKKIY